MHCHVLFLATSDKPFFSDDTSATITDIRQNLTYTGYVAILLHSECIRRYTCLKIIKNANNVHPTSFPGYLAQLWWRSMHGTTPFNDFVAEVAKQYPMH